MRKDIRVLDHIQEYIIGQSIPLISGGQHLELEFATGQNADYTEIKFYMGGIQFGFHKINHSTAGYFSNLTVDGTNLKLNQPKTSFRYEIEANNTGDNSDSKALKISLIKPNAGVYSFIGTDDVRIGLARPAILDFVISDNNKGVNIRYESGKVIFQY